MLSPPAALPEADLAGAVARAWGLRVAALDYRAVGFGSHHWAVVAADGSRWFVTVDELVADDAFDRLVASLSAARALRAAGRDFVVAPVSTVDGAVAARLGPGFAVAVYPHVDGRSFDWGSFTGAEQRDAVLGMVVGVHTAPAEVRRWARVDDFAVPHLSTLDAALAGAGAGRRTVLRAGRGAAGMRATRPCARCCGAIASWSRSPIRPGRC